ncbi:MAG: hypothetical protein HKM05_06185 [Spirochaetales bacterium]|nr:hypothetical protein [Spirochaetales bacterium]
MKKLLVLAFAGILMGLGGTTFAQEASGAPHKQPYWATLGLTQDQMSRVQSIFEGSKAFIRVEKAKLGVVKAKIRLAMTSSAPDLKLVDTLVDQQMTITSAIEKNMLEAAAKIHTLVGDQAYYALKAKFFHHHHWHKEHHEFD